MKLYTKSTLALLAGVALFSTSCKKDSKPAAPAPQTDQMATVGGLVAANLAKGLSGSLGGANIGEGLTPSAAAVTTAGKTTNSGSSTVCGFVTSNINFKSDTLGVKETVTGSNQFFFNCTNGKPTGYTIADEQFTVGTGPGYAFNFDVAQDYAVTSLNPFATQLSVDGKLKAFQDFTYTNKAYKPTSEHDSFVLSGMVVDISTKGKVDILGGTATFETKGFNAFGAWDFVGTLDFLGHNVGKITFYGKIYFINLVTGKVTA